MKTQKIFLIKEQDHKYRSMRMKKRLIPSAKITKWGIITISVYQNVRWGRRYWRSSPVIMIKLPGLAEDLLWQIKSMSTDNTIADLLMSSHRIIRAVRWTRKKFKRINFTYLDIPNHSWSNRRKLTFPHVEQFGIWRTIFCKRDKKLNLCFLIRKKHLFENLWEGDFYMF